MSEPLIWYEVALSAFIQLMERASECSRDEERGGLLNFQSMVLTIV